MLLRNFAAADGSLRVFAIDREATYTSRTLGFGQVKGGHNRVRPDGTVDREFLEKWMSSIEGAAARDIAALVASNRSDRQRPRLPVAPVVGEPAAQQKSRAHGLLKVQARSRVDDGD